MRRSSNRQRRGSRQCYRFVVPLLLCVIIFVQLTSREYLILAQPGGLMTTRLEVDYFDLLQTAMFHANDQEEPPRAGPGAYYNQTEISSPHNSSNESSSNPNESLPMIRINDLVFDAYFANGSLGYVADPAALARHQSDFVRLHINASFEDLLLNYYTSAIDNTTALLQVCSQPAGTLDEAPEGVELLTRKIKIALPTTSPAVRLLCAVYTHAPMRPLARIAALTYGHKCDGFVAFSTETISELGLVHLHHAGPESYQNMWQKVRSIWSYLRLHYAQDYDYFHLGGDDMYVLVENMRQFLSQLPNDRSLHLGQWVRQKNHPYVAGGPGYTLNRQALYELVDHSLPSCQANTVAPFEDKLVSECLRQVGITPFDTRDFETGQQRYHAAQPATVYKSRPKSGRGASFQARAQAYFANLPHPRNDSLLVGPQYGLDAAASDSVTFHNLHNPVYMARVHAILYNACPDDSVLAKSLASRVMR